MIHKRWTEYKYIFMGFIVPLVIMLFSFFIMQITPFGEFSLLVSDGDAQSIDRITGFRNIFFEGKSFLYTWGQIQGSTPFGFMGMDPFFFLYLLVDDNHVLEMVTLVTALKIACAGASCAYYLKKTFKRNDMSISIFSWCYALMSFSIAYHFLFGFENSLILLPLLLVGVERLLENSKYYIFFTILLTISFIIDYYWAYILGGYCFIYFCYRYATTKNQISIKELMDKLIHFFVCPILAFGSSTFMLIPIFAMMTGRDGLFEANNMNLFLRYHFTDLLSKLFIGSMDTVLPGNFPYIYCGVIILVLIGCYFTSYIVSYKEKLLTFILLAFMVLSLTVNPLYVAWHGFKPPVYFEARFSFAVSFTMVFVAYRGYWLRETVSDQALHRICLVLLGIFLLINRRDYSFLHDDSLMYSVLFLAGYYLIFMIQRKTQYTKSKVTIMLAMIVAFELSSNASLMFENLDNLLHYPKKEDYYVPFVKMKAINKQLKEMDRDFYRMEFIEKRGLNDGFGVGFASITHFDSTYNYYVKEKVGQLGLSTGHNWIQYEGSTPIVDTLLNIKYVMTKKDDYFGYEQVKKIEDTYIMKNPFSVSVGFMSHDALNDLNSKGDPLQFQEEILNKISGKKDNIYYVELPIIKQDNINNKQYVMNVVDEQNGGDKIYYVQDTNQPAYFTYEIKTATDGPCFMTVNSGVYKEFKVSVNDQLVKDVGTQDAKSIYLGNFKKGKIVQVRLDQAETDFQMNNVVFRQMDNEVVKETFDELRKSAFKVADHTETLLKGTIIVIEDQSFLVTSIPYDEGWQVYVDGQRVQVQQVYDEFLGMKLTKGEHTIEMRYCPQGFKLGLLASGLSVLLIILIAIRHKKEEKAVRKIVDVQK